MNFHFIVNKYFLIWNLLYRASISEEIHGLKQKLWKNYKKDYSSLYSEKVSILKDVSDYIPNDDFLYNLIEENDEYKKIKQETNRYRLLLLELWDMNKKTYLKELNNLLKIKLNKDYQVLVLHPNIDVIETDFETSNIIVGKKLSIKDKDNFITYLIYKILKEDFEKIKSDDRDIINAILELTITNELFTRMTKESKYSLGKKALKEIKNKIYPYWLMYLGVSFTQMEKYMIRDNIYFITNDYDYNEDLQDYDIYDFIDFCLKHKRQIFSKAIRTIEDIEVI